MKPICYGTGMQNPVLIVIDMLNDFLEKWDRSDRDRLVDAINELVQIVRHASRPVIWVRQEFESADLSDAFPEMKVKNIHIVIKGTSGSRSRCAAEGQPVRHGHRQEKIQRFLRHRSR